MAVINYTEGSGNEDSRIEVLSPDATEAGGQLILDNFRVLADRVPVSKITTTAPGATDDGANTSGAGVFQVGSRWKNTSTDLSYECMDNSTGAAIWKQIVDTDSTQTLTNKTISGASNTVTNVSLTTGVTGTLPIANGGTGQTSQTPAFDALAPTTTAGDLVVYNGTDNIRLPVGASGYLVFSDPNAIEKVAWGYFDYSSMGSGTVPISKGGTGQTTQTTAFDALSPTTTAGDLIVYDGTDNVRLAVGASGYIATSDPNATNKISWLPASGGSSAFGTVAVSGQNNVVADQTNDTLTLVNGAGINITTDDTTDAVTIAFDGAGLSALWFGTISVFGQDDVVSDAIGDTLTLAVSAGITIVTDAPSDTITFGFDVSGAGVLSFSTIAVSGESDVVADDAYDTLTLAEGNNVVITTDAGTDTITFAANSNIITIREVDDTDSPVTAGANDELVILCSATNGAITVNLPVAASSAGRQFVIKKTDSSANAVTIDADGTEEIDGSTTQVLNTQYESLSVVCDSTTWHIF